MTPEAVEQAKVKTIREAIKSYPSFCAIFNQCSAVQLKEAEELIKKYNIDLNQIIPDPRYKGELFAGQVTLLHYACRDSVPITRFLMEAGANIKTPSERKCLPEVYAFMNCTTRVQTQMRIYFLSLGIKFKPEELYLMFLHISNEFTDRKNLSKQNVEHIQQLLEAIIKAGVDINALYYNHSTLAATIEELPAVKFLEMIVLAGATLRKEDGTIPEIITRSISRPYFFDEMIVNTSHAYEAAIAKRGKVIQEMYQERSNALDEATVAHIPIDLLKLVRSYDALTLEEILKDPELQLKMFRRCIA